jgi:hypothetical protein
MKVFISWSGQRSKQIANALREWLPMALQYIEPWVSDKDVSAGERWAQVIAGELEAANFGIICVTPENIHSEWILFEAGALSKSMQEGKVIPLLFGLELSDLSGPLSQFQAQKLEETGVKEIVKSINKISSTKTSDAIVDQIVPALWPRLSEKVSSIPQSAPHDKHMRPNHEILEELVVGIRGINSSIRELEPSLKDQRSYQDERKQIRMNPNVLNEFAFLATEAGGRPLPLLMLAGIYRERLPWLAEILAEAYREIRDGNRDAAEQTFNSLRRTIKYILDSKIYFELFGGSRENYFALTDETMDFLEMALRQINGNNSPGALRLEKN